jgi:hypothetical protein
MTDIGLNRKLIRAIYPQIDWNQYDKEVIAEVLPHYKATVDALEMLADAATALENRAVRSGGEFHVWAEERMVTEARDKARAVLRRPPP